MNVITVAMQKGGVGKSTTAAHVAAGLADMGRRVLLVDLDPQCSATDFFGLAFNPERCVYEFVMEGKVTESIYCVRNFHIVPGDRSWRDADMELYPEEDGRHKLKNALNKLRQTVDFDFVVVDTPPNLGSLTANALVAANQVLVPVRTAQEDVNKVPVFLEFFDRVKANLNQGSRLAGILPTQYDARRNQDRELVETLRSNPRGIRCFEPIPHRVRITECFTRKAPVYDFARDDSYEYERLVEAISVEAL